MARSLATDRPKSAVGKHWSGKDKIRAIASYLVLGNMAAVSDETGIPLGTLNYWKSQPWWFEQVAKIRQEEDAEIDSTFTKLVKKTQAAMLERLENGDYYVTKDGGIARKPVSFRDVAIVSAIAVDKRKLLRDVPVAEANKVGMQERLQNLEKEFKKLVKREESIIDITAEQTDGEEELQAGGSDRDPGEETSAEYEESSPAGDDKTGEGESGGWEGRGPQEGIEQGGQEHLSQSGDAVSSQEPIL